MAHPALSEWDIAGNGPPPRALSRAERKGYCPKVPSAYALSRVLSEWDIARKARRPMSHTVLSEWDIARKGPLPIVLPRG